MIAPAFDPPPTLAELEDAEADVRRMRAGRPQPLDTATDALPTRRRAHVVEEIFRSVVPRPGLWRYRTADLAILARALDAIEDLGKKAAARGGRKAAARLQAPDAPESQVAPTDASASDVEAA